MKTFCISKLDSMPGDRIFEKCSMCSTKLGEDSRCIVTDNATHLYNEAIPDSIIVDIHISIPDDAHFEHTVLCVNSDQYESYMTSNMLNNAKVLSAICGPCAHLVRMGIVMGDVKEICMDPFGSNLFYAWVPAYYNSTSYDNEKVHVTYTTDSTG